MSPVKDKMRGAGGRMLCSPYFVGATFLFLLVVSVKYWSLSGENGELADRLEQLQLQLRTESFNLKNLQSSLSQKEERLESCDKAKGALNGELEEKARRLREKEEECGDVRRRNVQCGNELISAQEDLQSCRDEKKTLDERAHEQGKVNVEEVEERDRQIRELTEKLAAAEGEIATLKMREEQEAGRAREPKIRGRLNAPSGPVPPGELPDVPLGAVHVREKAVQGMVGHVGPDGRFLPLLPRGDPDKPRPPPRFSVVDMPREDLHKKRLVKEKKRNDDGDAEKDDEEEELNAAKEDEEQEQKDGEVEEGVANRLEEGGGGGNAQENALREAEPGQIPPADSPDQDEEKLEKEENVDKNAIDDARELDHAKDGDAYDPNEEEDNEDDEDDGDQDDEELGGGQQIDRNLLAKGESPQDT